MDHITRTLYSGHSSGGICSCCFQIAAPPLPSFCFNWVLVSQGCFCVWDQTGSSYQANGTSNLTRQRERERGREVMSKSLRACVGCYPPLTHYVFIFSSEASLAVSDRFPLVTTWGHGGCAVGSEWKWDALGCEVSVQLWFSLLFLV